MEYTNAPWVVDKQEDTGEIVIRGSEHGGHFIVANLEVDDYWDERKGRIEANAHLIAAAPDLYEACLSALGVMATLDQNKGWVREISGKIQQALDKVEDK